jgi:hypothetical protein
MCGFCYLWMYVWVLLCVGSVMCGCVYVWVLLFVGVCMCGCFDSCVGVLAIYVLAFTVFCIISFMCIYSYLLLV